MTRVADDVKDMLEEDSALGLVFGAGGNLFINKEPTPPPKRTVTIFSTHGRPPDLTLVGKEGGSYYRPSIQIRVRGVDQRQVEDLINDIVDSLHGRGHESWNGTLYTVITCSSGPALLDWDENGLVRFIVNFNLQRR